MPMLQVHMLKIQINTMAMLLSEFDFLPIYRADLAGSRTLSFDHISLIYGIIGTQERVQISQGKRVIRVRVIEVLLYNHFPEHKSTLLGLVDSSALIN